MDEWTCRYCHTSNQPVWGDCSGCGRARDVFTSTPEPTTAAEAPTTFEAPMPAEPAPFNPIQGSAGAAFRPHAPSTPGWSTPQSPTPTGWTPPTAPNVQPGPWPQQPGQPAPGPGFGNAATVGVFRPTAYCTTCGGIIDAQAEICPRCGVRQRVVPGPGIRFSAGAMACAFVGFLIAPFIFGPIAIGLSTVARQRGERWWLPALIISIVGPALGWIIGMLAFFAD